MTLGGIRRDLSRINKAEPSRLWMLLLSLPILLASAIIAAAFLVASTRLGHVVETTGRADGRFRVLYVVNETFPENPIPPNLHFLMSFTDFIEVDSRFSARFSEEVTVYYTYVSSKRLVIRYMATVDGNHNPIVFQEDTLFAEFRGSVTADSLQLSGQGAGGSNGNGTWGTYVINPREHIDIYLAFVADQRRQMYQENIVAQGMRNFSAELFVDFEYGIYIPEWGVNETVTQGYRIPLSTEVYFFAATGIPTLNSEVNLSVPPLQPTLFMVVLYALFLGLGVYGLFAGIKVLKAHPNPRKQKGLDILKKYANEIVVTDMPLTLNDLILTNVADFDAILRLAINLNKHIMCFHDDVCVEFAVVVDGYAYCFRIQYDDKNDDMGIEAAPEPVAVRAR